MYYCTDHHIIKYCAQMFMYKVLINFVAQFFWETELLGINFFFWRKPFWHIWMAKWSHRSLFISLNLLFLDYLNLCTWNLSQSVTWVINTHTHTHLPIALGESFKASIVQLSMLWMQAVMDLMRAVMEGFSLCWACTSPGHSSAFQTFKGYDFWLNTVVFLRERS